MIDQRRGKGRRGDRPEKGRREKGRRGKRGERPVDVCVQKM